MAETLICEPCFDGRPDYDPNLGTAILPLETLARSRKTSGGTFFRSKLTVPGDTDFQGVLCNDISLEVVLTGNSGGNDNFDLVVYFEDIEVERYSVVQDDTCPVMGTGTAINSLRAQTASSIYISMPVRGTDAQDAGGMDSMCLTAFAKSNMSGGDGPGEADVPLIRTGPDRAIVFISSRENSAGTPFAPGAGSNLIQWDFDALQFIAYVIDADCALPDNRCP